MQWATSLPTLLNQVGMPLVARCKRFNQIFGKTLKLDHFQQIYKNARVTKKIIRSRLGRPKLKPREIQAMELEQVRQRLAEQRGLGYEIIQLDECLFNADSKRAGTWSTRNQPIQTRSRFSNKPVVVVCGAISPRRGSVYFKFGYRSFNRFDMVDMFKQIRLCSRRHAKLCVFLDNASYHKSPEVKDSCKLAKSNINLEYNRPYRPDLNGIEFAWANIKRRYRDRISWLKANGRDYDHMEVVKAIVEETPENIFKAAALQGEKNLAKALPVDRLYWEPEPPVDWVEQVRALEALRAPTELARRARLQETDSGDSQVE